MVNNYLVSFVTDYGLRDGVLLSSICKYVSESKDNNACFDRYACEKLLPFYTLKQIRSGLLSLSKAKCIIFIPNNSFERISKYKINPEILTLYYKSLLNMENGKNG